MATAIAALPNEVPENKVIMKVEEKNMKVPNPPKQESIQESYISQLVDIERRIKKSVLELSSDYKVPRIIQGISSSLGNTD